MPSEAVVDLDDNQGGPGHGSQLRQTWSAAGSSLQWQGDSVTSANRIVQSSHQTFFTIQILIANLQATTIIESVIRIVTVIRMPGPRLTSSSGGGGPDEDMISYT